MYTAAITTSMNPQAYSYPPLDKSRNEIRLLWISHSDIPGISFHCHLEVFDLDNAPTFTSLSYAWGGTTRDVPLHTSDGSIIMIGQNLHDFLRHGVNDPLNDTRPWLWIDQLSIDQSSVAEKNHQVNLMSRIYRECECVIAWLGCDEAAVKAAQQFKDCPSVTTLETILDNHYFSRLWIVQEFLLAREVRILCGRVWLQCYVIWKLCINLRGSGPEAAFLFIDRNGGSKRTLANCIMPYCAKDCFDPRDRVYGLLGLVEDADTVSPDYGKSTIDTFKDAVRALKRAQPLDHMRNFAAAAALVRSMEIPLWSEHFDFNVVTWLHKCFPENVESMDEGSTKEDGTEEEQKKISKKKTAQTS
ncbi:heterokaryon incompatibility protein-domain-containing protein [Paraphoma chrysanthemicola]|uniref:Heterokaryon incompatibility protein-domain-containing protein n=1 Tax=Paraphoma chrysanthemicola TaxID=798071 RepID=A0A8K0REM7_9PLEO|nr:heterokaryon incompatibility protein-domain-containing protein [Paraphoma chrysanthemicola]